jgi:hypothetical protein
MLPEIKVLLSIKKSFHLPAAWCMVSTHIEALPGKFVDATGVSLRV